MAHALPLRLRESGGLAITIGAHALIGAALLIGLTIVNRPQGPPRPILTRNVPLPPRAAPVAPVTTEQKIVIDVPEPVITAVAPVRADWLTKPVPDEPAIDPPGAPDPGPVAIVSADPAPAGPTASARLDRRYANDFQPPYPAAARRLEEAGTVTIRVTIGRDGRVLAASVAKSSGSPRLDAAAVAQALAKWRFVPAQADGIAIEAARDISVVFKLENA